MEGGNESKPNQKTQQSYRSINGIKQIPHKTDVMHTKIVYRKCLEDGKKANRAYFVDDKINIHNFLYNIVTRHIF